MNNTWDGPIDETFLGFGELSALHVANLWNLATTPGVNGDYNDDGVVDAADYVQWRKSLTTQDPLANDPLGLPIDQDQYDQWRANFGNTSGSGSFTGNSAVPEPTSVMLLFLAIVGGMLIGRSRGA